MARPWKNYKHTRTRQALCFARVANSWLWSTLINLLKMSWVTEKRAIKCHRKQNKKLESQKKTRSSWRIIDGLMQTSTHEINTLPQPEITRTIISLPFNRAHFVKNELKQARVKILTVKRRGNEVRSFQAILASSWDSNERRQSMPCRRGFHSFSCQILRCWRHPPPSLLLFFPSRVLFYFRSPGACFSKVPKLRVPQERGTSWFCIFGGFNDAGWSDVTLRRFLPS